MGVQPTEIMKKTIAILALAALGITSVNAGVHVGISLGIPAPALVAPAPVVVAPTPVMVAPPMPAPFVEVVPVCPTPGYIWVGGSWGWCNNHWVWTRGHWGSPVHWGYADHGGFHGGRYAGCHGGHGHR